MQESEERITPVNSFDNAGLHPAMRRNVELAGYKIPTPIQQYCLPAIKQGHDMIAIAQTGRSPHSRLLAVAGRPADLCFRFG